MATAYALVVAKSGPKLLPANPGETAMITMVNDRMTVENSTVEEWIHSRF